jgi:hypothetical protein
MRRKNLFNLQIILYLYVFNNPDAYSTDKIAQTVRLYKYG